METERTLFSGPDEEGVIFKTSIHNFGGNNGLDYIFFEVKRNTIDIEDNEYVGLCEDLEVDFKFGMKIEHAFYLRDFLNQVLPDLPPNAK